MTKPPVACRSSADARKNEFGSLVRSFFAPLVVRVVRIFAARMRDMLKPASTAQSSLYWSEVHNETKSQQHAGGVAVWCIVSAGQSVQI
jgi:hypothetical protein